MTFLERLFSIKISDLTLPMTNIKELLFQPNKSTDRVKEHYPSKMRFRVYLKGDNYIGRLDVAYTIRGLGTTKLEYKEVTVESRIKDKDQYTIVAVNKLYRDAVKLFFSTTREKGFKECLLQHCSIEDTNDGYVFDYNITTKIKENYKALI